MTTQNQNGYYISTGRLNKMYTLREVIVEGDRTYDNFLCSLSTDLEKAENRAAEIIGCGIENLAGTLIPITRRTAEEKAAQEKEQQEKEQQQILENERRINLELEEGRWPFGKYKGMPLSYDDEYAMYMFKTVTDNPKLTEAIRKTYPDECAGILKVQGLKDGNGEHYGAEKEKLTGVPVTVLELYGFNGYFGWTDVTTFATETGELLVHMGKRPAIKGADANYVLTPGQEVTINATIKEHTEYRGTVQTKIIRPKIII